MTTFHVRGQIDPDGTLRLAVPVGLPPGPAEVLVVVQSDAAAVAPDPEARPLGSARSGLFTRTAASEALDIDAVRREINEAWQSKLLEGL